MRVVSGREQQSAQVLASAWLGDLIKMTLIVRRSTHLLRLKHHHNEEASGSAQEASSWVEGLLPTGDPRKRSARNFLGLDMKSNVHLFTLTLSCDTMRGLLSQLETTEPLKRVLRPRDHLTLVTLVARARSGLIQQGYQAMTRRKSRQGLNEDGRRQMMATRDALRYIKMSLRSLLSAIDIRGGSD
jgi:hypothetical protein